MISETDDIRLLRERLEVLEARLASLHIDNPHQSMANIVRVRSPLGPGPRVYSVDILSPIAVEEEGAGVSFEASETGTTFAVNIGTGLPLANSAHPAIVVDGLLCFCFYG